MIMATPKPRRFRAAYDHFFRLSLALRALETCGKPVASAIAGLALGGGGELALASHYRVLTDDKHAAIGLPESLVGLLPGAGGTQRLPRLVGIERAMPMLLEGKRLAGEAAVDGGLADKVVKPGEEIAAAEAWLLSLARAGPALGPRRLDVARASGGERGARAGPARGARGLARPLSRDLRDPRLRGVRPAAELRRRDPQRDDELLPSGPAARAARDDPDDVPRPRRLTSGWSESSDLPEVAQATVAAVKAEVEKASAESAALAAAGFAGLGEAAPVRDRQQPGYWIEGGDEPARAALAVLRRIHDAAHRLAAGQSGEDLRVADYAAVRRPAIPPISAALSPSAPRRWK